MYACTTLLGPPLILCVYIYVGGIYTYVHSCVYVCVGVMLSVFLSFSPPYFCKTGILIEPAAPRSGWTAWFPSSLVSPVLGDAMCTAMPGFYAGALDPNSGLRVSTVTLYPPSRLPSPSH